MTESVAKKTVKRRAAIIVDNPAAAAPAGIRIQVTGCMNPNEAEVTIYATLKDQRLAAAPVAFEAKAKAVSMLVSNRADLVPSVAHKRLLSVDENAQAVLRQAHSDARAMPIQDRTIAVVGDEALMDAALNNTFRVIMFIDGDDLTLPEEIRHWTVSKVDKRTTPPSIQAIRGQA